MTSSGFEVLEHTADVGITAWADDTAGAFVNAARGMFSIIADLEEVRDSEERTVTVAAPSEEELLVAWLNELLYYFDTQNTLFCRFEMVRLQDTELEAHAFGERFDPSRHHLNVGIKAVTYHMLQIDHSRGCRVRVIFDI